MLAALVIAVIQPMQYRSTLVCTVPASVMRGYIHCAVLTDQETVAGYTCESVGHHGETFFGKPFVWTKGRFNKLPLPPEAEYGHVYGGNDRLLVGSVAIDYRDRPVTWTPDPSLGWAKAKLKILSMKEGYATHIGSDGAIWVQKDNQVTGRFRQGKWEPISMGKFELKHIDSGGRLFGNQFTGITFGNRPHGTSPAIYREGAWKMLKVEKTSQDFGGDASLQAANSSGVAIGRCQNQAAIWKNDDVSLFLNGKKRWSYAYDVNDAGAVVGECAVVDINKSMPFLWQDGKLTDLSKSAPGLELEGAHKINNHGVIAAVASVNREVRLYLLRPSK